MASVGQKLLERPFEASLWPAPWAFSILIMPQGIYLGFITTALPFFLSRASVPVDEIARITSLASLPWVICFIWAPLVDSKLRRRTWLLITASLTASCLSTSFFFVRTARIEVAVLFALGGAMAASLVFAACGGLMATTLNSLAKSRGSAWYEGGKLGSSALGAAFLIFIADRTAPSYGAIIIGLIAIAPALLVLTIEERANRSSTWFKGRFPELWSETKVVMNSDSRWNILLLASPIGAGAMVALLPAIAHRYSVGPTGVIWINGIGGGIVLAVGSLCGALLPGEWDRRMTYAAAGLTSGIAAVILLCGVQPQVYFLATVLYLGTTGFSWSCYTALLLDTVGAVGRGMSTRYSLLAAAGNLPLAYMVFLDGQCFKRFGVNGLVSMDAAANLLVFAAVVLVLMLNRHKTALQKATEY